MLHMLQEFSLIFQRLPESHGKSAQHARDTERPRLRAEALHYFIFLCSPIDLGAALRQQLPHRQIGRHHLCGLLLGQRRGFAHDSPAAVAELYYVQIERRSGLACRLRFTFCHRASLVSAVLLGQ
jgi:hypothetical protein